MPLKRCAQVRYGLGQPPSLAPGGVPIIRATNIHRGQVTKKDLIFSRLEDLPLDRAPLLRVGEVLVVRSGAYTGDSALITKEWAGSAPGYDLRLSPREGLEPRYLAYSMLSRWGLDQIDLAKMRAAQPHLNAEDLGEVRLVHLTFAGQRAIADYLDTETTRIDALIAKKRLLLAKLSEREGGALNELFSSDGVIHRTRLSRFATIQGGVTVDAGRADVEGTLEYPYLRVANVQPGRLDLGEVKTVRLPPGVAARCRLRAGDVLMTEGGDIDKLGRGTVWRDEVPGCLHQNHVFAVRPAVDRLLPDYLALFTRTAEARAYFEQTGVQSTNLASTNTSKVLALRVPWRPIDEQQRIVDAIQRGAAAVAACGTALARQIELLVEHRQALITAAVTGELKIPGVAA